MDATTAGLSRAMAFPSHGYLEALAGITSAGPMAQAELGIHLAPGWALFTQGTYRNGDFGAVAGVRGEF